SNLLKIIQHCVTRAKVAYPLSPMQSGMLFHFLKSQQSNPYIEQTTFTLIGEIKKSLLERSFNILIERYDILRTVFVYQDLEEPLQIVLKNRKIQVYDEDIAHKSEDEIDDYLEKSMKKEREKGFDLSRDLLMKLSLFRTGSKTYKLTWTFHHILMDGWCLGIIYKEFIQIYRSLKEGKPLELEAVTPYINYIKWIGKQDKEAGLAFWQGYLEGYEEPAVLPGTRRKINPDQYRVEEHHLVIDEEPISRLKEIALENRVTMNTLFQILWGILLQRYNNGSDVVFGAVVSGRPPEIKGIENMVGLFINTVPVRIRLNPRDQQEFSQLLPIFQEHAASAKPYEYLPLAEIQARSSLKGDLIRHIIAFENFPLPEQIKEYGIADDPGFHVENMKLHEQTNYDFNLIIAPGKPFKLRFSYNALVYDGDFIKRVGMQLHQVINQVIANPNEDVHRLDIITREEKHRILVDFNQTEAAYPKDKTIHGLFAEQVERTPDNIALKGLVNPKSKIQNSKQEGTGGLAPLPDLVSITYRELNKKSDQLAYLLKVKGVQPDTIVGIIVERSVEMIVGILAILKAGGAYLPIDPHYPEERINYILQDSSAKILLTGQEIADFSSPSHLHLSPAPATSLAYIIYTSGTTGKPKGVMILHRNVVRLMFNDQFPFDFSQRDVWTMFHSYCFDFSVWEMYGALLYGGQLVLISRMTARDPGRFLQVLQEKGVTVLNQTPSAFYNLMDIEKTRVKSLDLRYVIFGGEALNPTKLKEWKARYPNTRLINMYGITETTVHVTFKEITHREIQEGTSNIGRPIPTLKTYILDLHQNLVPVGAPGELYVGGDGVGKGYLNQPELTAERFGLRRPGDESRAQSAERIAFGAKHTSFLGSPRRGAWTPRKNFLLFLPYSPYSPIYQTGDLGRFLENGDIEYLGRIDHQVKIRGYRIELSEIESQLLKHEAIKETVVLAKKTREEETYLCAYVVTNHSLLSITGLKQYLAKQLPDYMIPAHIIPLEKLPLTPNGKLDRNALPGPGITPGNTNAYGMYDNYTAPGNEVEKKIANIWAEILEIHRNQIGIDTSFFQLGGHSLKVMILAAKIHKKLDAQIPIKKIFEISTIRELAQYIKTVEKNEYASLEPVEKKEYYPLSSAQKRLYFLGQLTSTPAGMNLNSSSYNIPLILPMGKDIEKNRLESALKQLIASHESLRTSFIKVDDEPVQKIHDEVEFEIEYYDVSQVEVEEERSFIRPFDLSQAPLIRSGLIRQPDGNHTWMLDIHHIISDGTSLSILAEDFMALYNKNENPLEPQPLRVQYKDFSKWQGHLLETARVKARENYWLELFAGEIPRLDFPIDYQRPKVFTFKGDNHSFTLERAPALKFKEMGTMNGATLYMNILAALNTLVYKYTGQGDIIIGSGIAGRNHADLQHIIGMFVNTLAMRNFPQGEKTYESFLKEVTTNCLKAFENQEVQFEELVDKLDLDRDTSRNPLFDISMVVQNFKQPGQKDADTHLLSNHYKNPTAKFDLTFYLHEIKDDININIEYYTGIFKQETIRRLAGHFNNVVKAVVREPSIKLKDIEIICESEKNQLLYEFNHTFKEYPANKTIHQLFRDQVEKTPDNTALIGEIPGPKSQIPNQAVCRTYKQGAFDRTISITYKELDKKANQLAHYLFLKMGKKVKHTFQEKLVGIFMDKTIELMAVVLGILKSGAAYVPLDTASPAKRLETIINDAGIEMVISQKKYLKTLNRLQWECSCLHTYLCIDSYNIRWEEEEETGELMSEKLWNYIGETAVDDISAGGWVSSYTGQPLSREEMEEYGNNLLEKLAPLLHPQMRVLEIGCASGISMYRIAPKVLLYYGTDLSTVIIDKNKKRIQQEQHQNIKLSCLPAHEIDKIKEQEKEKFDLIIMNSVIQCFPGYNYLGKVIHKIIGLLGEKGYLFIGDVMDQEKKNELIREMTAFKYSEANKNKGYTTKTDFSAELFLSKDYWKDLGSGFKEIVSVCFSDKIYNIENELTRFRYDVLITIDKQSVSREQRQKQKFQEDLNDLSGFGSEPLPLQGWAGSLAYIIYTSGTTGRPKGVMVNHYPVVNLVQSQQEYFGIHEKDRILQFSSICFDASVE
ncbi:MAG: amino acid adenylation domain-containing protein, partial [Candidatus Aminicenantes bacterium]